MALQIQRSFNQKEKLWSITLAGDVDISTAHMLRKELDEAYRETNADILLHFDDLAYMDSTGLGVIIGAYSRMQEEGNGIILRNPRDNIKKLLRITSLDRLLCPELCE